MLVEAVPATRRHFIFIKIDTDTIDCYILEQIIDMIDSNALAVDSLVLESWDSSCQTGKKIGHLLARLARHKYTIYRTHVTDRAWDDNNHEINHRWAPIAERPPEFTEQFSQRFNLVLWKARSNVTDDESWIRLSVGRIWQFFITKDELVSQGYITGQQ